MASWINGSIPKDKSKKKRKSMKEIDKEKEYLRGCLKIAEKRKLVCKKGSLTRDFWENQVEIIKQKLEK